MDIRIADEVWIATALLHREQPQRRDFTVNEIVQRAVQENIAGGYRQGLPVHASLHCVAQKAPNPGRYCMLTETGRGHRRLFRKGDAAHPERTGKITPEREAIPAKYHYLLDWYRDEYEAGRHGDGLPPGSPGSALLGFVGTLPGEDAAEMMRIIEQDCERIDEDE